MHQQITKKVRKNSHFENMKAGFLLRCQNSQVCFRLFYINSVKFTNSIQHVMTLVASLPDGNDSVFHIHLQPIPPVATRQTDVADQFLPERQEDTI